MLTLNLISPQHKKELKSRETGIIIKNIAIVILALAIVSSVILFSAQTIIVYDYSKVVEETTLVTKPLPRPRREIKDFNKQLKTIQEIQKQFVSFSKILLHFSKNTPHGVIINSLEIDRINKTVNIQGKAKLREDFLNFKGNLEASEVFTKPEFPISSLLKKENINFDIEAELNLKDLNQLNKQQPTN